MNTEDNKDYEMINIIEETEESLKIVYSSIYLTEDAIYKSSELSIHIDKSETDYNFDKDPYFKVYNGLYLKNADHVARISLLRAQYMPSHQTDGIPLANYNWHLSSSDTKLLVKALKSKVTCSNGTKITVLEKLNQTCDNMFGTNYAETNSIQADKFKHILNASSK